MKKIIAFVLLVFILPLISFGQIALEKKLKLGDKDNQVAKLKIFLIKEGIYKRFLGIEFRKNHFGKKTQKALKEWQKLKNLSETGELDEKTKESVNKTLVGDNISPEKNITEPAQIKKGAEQTTPTSKDPFTLVAGAEIQKGPHVVYGKARLFIVTIDEGPSRKVEVLASRLVNLEVSIKNDVISIEPEETILSPLNLTLRGLMPNATYYYYIDTLENVKTVKTDSLGMFTTSIDSSVKKGIGFSPTAITRE